MLRNVPVCLCVVWNVCISQVFGLFMTLRLVFSPLSSQWISSSPSTLDNQLNTRMQSHLRSTDFLKNLSSLLVKALSLRYFSIMCSLCVCCAQLYTSTWQADWSSLMQVITRKLDMKSGLQIEGCSSDYSI